MDKIVATVILGAVISSVIAAFSTHNKTHFLLYVTVGCTAAFAFSAYPLVTDGVHAVAFRPIRAAALVCVAVGGVMLFSSGGRR